MTLWVAAWTSITVWGESMVRLVYLTQADTPISAVYKMFWKWTGKAEDNIVTLLRCKYLRATVNMKLTLADSIFQDVILIAHCDWVRNGLMILPPVELHRGSGETKAMGVIVGQSGEGINTFCSIFYRSLWDTERVIDVEMGGRKKRMGSINAKQLDSLQCGWVKD